MRDSRARAAALAPSAMFWPFALLVAASLLLLAGSAHAVVVTKASDVCASNADPCNVTSVMDIPNGLCTSDATKTCATNTDCTGFGFCKTGAVVLDFGTRDVVVSGGGQFNFGTASGRILAGDFTATTTGNAIDANGLTGSGSDSGTVRIYARRKCSTAHLPDYPAPACVSNSDCQLGACDTRRCELGTTKTCLADADCQVGPCVLSGVHKVCQKDTSRQCQTNSDCSLGACPAQLTCRARGDNPVECASNTDCNFGSCTVGTASIAMNGGIAGNSEFPAFVDLRAADNISTSKTINLNGTTADSDGGELSLDATYGSITVTGAVTATAGGFSTGGDISLYAGTDVTVGAEIDISGGDYDGGTIDIDAGRDVSIARSILANSTAGAGYGGEFLIVAGRDVSMTGVSAASKTSLESSGNVNQFNEAGDGGAQDITADRHVTLNVNTRLVSNGAAPDAVGGDIVVDATGNLVLNGDVTAKALGANGEGGTFEGYATGTLSVGSSGTIDLTGGADNAGELNLYSAGNMTFAGLADLGASNGGGAGGANLDSDGDASISGTLRITSGDLGNLTVNACRVTLTGTGKLDAGTTSTDNTIIAHESMKLLTGSLMKAGSLGSNRLIHRTAAKPPQVSGTVSPAPQLIVNGALVPCPVCGNGELDGGETCEDGNTANGDGCNSECQNEKCVQQTAAKIPCTTNADCGSFDCDTDTGFCGPWPLCEDGNVCTTDTCNTSLSGGTCQHASKNCADAFACTADSCDPADGSCDHVPNSLLCNDTNACTNDACSASLGCVFTANSDPCNDDNACTENDVCADQECNGTPIGGCGFCGDASLNGDEICDDGNATFAPGEYCGTDCSVLVPCGRPTAQTGTPKASDAQFTLRAAVAQVTCSLRVCDVDNTGKVVASDAQRILRKSVNQPITLNCPTTGS